ncbi:MAG: imelysin family protein [Planctomycetota bacterium]
MTPRPRWWLPLLLAPLFACGGGSASGEELRREVLRSLTDELLLPSVEALGRDAHALAEACDALAAAPGSATLADARERFRGLRATWRRGEVCVLGPLEATLVALRVDTPLDRGALEACLADATPIDANYAAGLGYGAKGFEALAALLFEGEPDARERALAQHAAAELGVGIDGIVAAWTRAGGLADDLRDPGPGRAFADADAGVDALVRRAVVLVQDARDRELAPLVGGTSKGVVQVLPADFDRARQHRLDLIERFRGLRLLYAGGEPGSEAAEGAGRGLSALIARVSARSDAAVRAALSRAVEAMERMPAELEAASRDDAPELRAAYDASTHVKTHLGVTVVSTLGTTLGFALADGD